MFLKDSMIGIMFACLCVLSSTAFALDEYIDVVIPCHEKDLRTLELAIEGIKKNGKNIRRIVTVSAKQMTEKAEWFDERKYPFTQLDLLTEIFRGDVNRAQSYMLSRNNRTGWIYQQFLKLYASLVIPDIAENVLILDSDTIFLRSVSFIDEEGNALYNTGKEYNHQYFTHGKQLIPGFKKVFSHHSGICHHMLMQRSIIEEIFKSIEEFHTCEPWKAMCRCIDNTNLFACISEYELYFNTIFAGNHTVKLRPLRYKDMKFNVGNIEKARQQGFDYVSCHAWQ